MSDYYKLVGSQNPAADWTTEVVLERDDSGKVTKSVSAVRPEQLTKGDVEKIEALGLKVESISKSDAEEAQREAALTAGSDTVGAAPVLGGSTDQGDDSAKSDDKAGSTGKSK